MSWTTPTELRTRLCQRWDSQKLLRDGLRGELIFPYEMALARPARAELAPRFAEVRAWIDEARRWKGEPTRLEDRGGRRLAVWPDLELRQAGRGVMVRVRAPDFSAWWHASDTWSDDPMAAVHDWIEEDGGPA